MSNPSRSRYKRFLVDTQAVGSIIKGLWQSKETLLWDLDDEFNIRQFSGSKSAHKHFRAVLKQKLI